MNRKLAALTATVLIVLIIISLFIALNSTSNQTPTRPFYVGVEYAYGNNLSAELQLAQIDALLNKVKDYTNLFVMGDVSLTFNRTALTQACDNIYNHSKLDFVILFTGGDRYSYNIAQWMFEANDRYGSRFLGIYKYDEPGGNQLDNTPGQLINKTVIEPSASYADIASAYVGNLTFMVNFYREHGQVNLTTSDYGLFWFDYKSNYSTIYSEFVGNESRQRIIALDRGAAKALGKDWGVIIAWKYNQDPFLENGTELYNDLELAYSSGARYAFVFSYSPYPIDSQYGILKEEHFEALRKFWNNLHDKPASLPLNNAEAAYVVPRNYGFGFRFPTDTIWGLKPADELSAKIFADTNIALPKKFGSRFDILYDEPEIIVPLLGNYTSVYYWNQTIP